MKTFKIENLCVNKAGLVALLGLLDEKGAISDKLKSYCSNMDALADLIFDKPEIFQSALPNLCKAFGIDTATSGVFFEDVIYRNGQICDQDDIARALAGFGKAEKVRRIADVLGQDEHMDYKAIAGYLIAHPDEIRTVFEAD